jgi:methyl-accepting chemotaxis protein
VASNGIFGVFKEAGTLRALREAFAVIEFLPNGEILAANDKFLELMGYQAAEIIGQHHRIFAPPGFAGTAEYAAFWDRLGRGEAVSGEFQRMAKGGREVWLQASYTPVTDHGGKVVKVIKLALDITAAKRKAMRDLSLITAINRAQAVIEFATDGTILDANENFLATMGYSLAEIKGRKHSLFIDPSYAASQDYRDFWRRLNAGEFVSAEFRRVAKGGREVWLQASYNPVFDAAGKVVSVVKFATDLAERMRNVDIVTDAMARLAKGELDQEIGVQLIPSLDKLRVDFNDSAKSLRTAMQAIAGSAASVQDMSGSVSHSAGQLAERTERQAANLEESAAAVSEITSMVSTAAGRVAEVRRVVGEAKSDTGTSESVVAEAVQAMSRIDESSAKIGQIIGVIDEIAFQTNLLALNAGVEAARAGDAGRGFAVVATEVRALAQRSADAAKEIKALITQSGSQVAAGVKAVHGAREALERIASHVGVINEAVVGIAASAQEQAEGLRQVNGAVSDMDQMTQQSAAMVEETAAAAQSLAREGEQIMTLVSRFRTGSETPAARPPARKRAPELV